MLIDRISRISIGIARVCMYRGARRQEGDRRQSWDFWRDLRDTWIEFQEGSKVLQNSRNIQPTSMRSGATAEFKDRFHVSQSASRKRSLQNRAWKGRGKMEIKRKIEKHEVDRGNGDAFLALPNDKWRPQDCASDIQLARPSSPCSALS